MTDTTRTTRIDRSHGRVLAKDSTRQGSNPLRMTLDTSHNLQLLQIDNLNIVVLTGTCHLMTTGQADDARWCIR